MHPGRRHCHLPGCQLSLLSTALSFCPFAFLLDFPPHSCLCSAHGNAVLLPRGFHGLEGGDFLKPLHAFLSLFQHIPYSFTLACHSNLLYCLLTGRGLSAFCSGPHTQTAPCTHSAQPQPQVTPSDTPALNNCSSEPPLCFLHLKQVNPALPSTHMLLGQTLPSRSGAEPGG